MLIVIEGSYLDGDTSRRVAARLEFDREVSDVVSIQILTRHQVQDEAQDHNQSVIRFGVQDLNIASRLGNTPREINIGQALFITEQNDTVDALAKLINAAPGSLLMHRLESSLPVIMLATIATGCLTWLLVVYGIPRMAEVVAYQLPSQATERIGANLSVLDEVIFSPTKLSVNRQQAINTLVAPYLAEHKSLRPKLNFRSAGNANAFALPNGDIVFTDAFVGLVEDDAELLAVLFHELGHLRYKHILRRTLQDSMITLLIIFITGDVNTVDLLTGVPTLILDLAYSREFETEADVYALEQLHKAQIPLEHFATIMQRLEDYYGDSSADEVQKSALENDMRAELGLNELPVEVDEHSFTLPDFLSTHPATVNRVLLIEQFKSDQYSANAN